MSDLSKGVAHIGRYLNHISTKAQADSLYRGQANTEWEPTPTAFRFGQSGLTNRRQLDRWKSIASRFERAQSDIEWLVLAQHYGVATPLLDWTTNPLVALFFGAQHFAPKGTFNFADGVVFCLPQAAAWQESNPNFDIFTQWNGPPMLIDAGAMNRRSLAQASMMTLHCEGNHYMTPGHDTRVWTIPESEKRGILAALRVLGLSPESIYDDIGVAAREFSDQLTQEAVGKVQIVIPSSNQ